VLDKGMETHAQHHGVTQPPATLIFSLSPEFFTFQNVLWLELQGSLLLSQQSAFISSTSFCHWFLYLEVQPLGHCE
jgi:hypothetical protein